MKIGMGYAAFVRNTDFPLKAKESTTAIALSSAVEQVVREIQICDDNLLGIVAATSYGPLDTYLASAEKLFTRGIRGLRPQKVVHSVICESSCQVGIQNQAKAFNMSFSGGLTSGFQAMKAAANALEEKMADTILVIGGDDSDSETNAGAVLLGGQGSAFYLKAVNIRFAYDSALILDMKDALIQELLKEAGISDIPYVISGEATVGDQTFSRTYGGSNLFSALLTAQELLQKGKDDILVFEVEQSGAMGGIIIGK